MGLLDQVGFGALSGGVRGIFGGTSEDRQLRNLSNAFYERKELQRYLPPSLRVGQTEPGLNAGIQGLLELIKNPGGLGNVSQAIQPRLAQESQSIAQNYRNIGLNQAGAAARGNLPVSIKTALQQALDIAQERAQRGARGAALSESEDLRRNDLQRTFSILDAILQFMQSGRGAGITGLGQAAGVAQNRQASNLAFLSSLLGSAGTAGIGR